MKNCSNKNCPCVNPQSLESFYKKSDSKDGRIHECIVCSKARQLKYRKANSDKIRQSQKVWDKANSERIKGIQLRRYYWPTLSSQEAFNKYKGMYDSQNGCCAICGDFEPNILDGLNVDHNHSDDNVRGLLCYSCNLGLGNFKDKISSLEKAISYIKNNGFKT